MNGISSLSKLPGLTVELILIMYGFFFIFIINFDIIFKTSIKNLFENLPFSN